MEISEPIVACIADLAFKYTGFYHTTPRFQANSLCGFTFI